MQTQQFADSLAWAKEQGYMDDAQARDLAANAITEQARQFDVSTASNMELAWAQFGESCRQFGVTTETQLALALETLEIQKQTLTDNEMITRMNMLTTILSPTSGLSTIVAPTDEQANILGGIVYDILIGDNDGIGNNADGTASSTEETIAAIITKYGLSTESTDDNGPTSGRPVVTEGGA
jgi:hypothetical protein